MPTIGQSSGSSNAFWYGINTKNAAWCIVTMPSPGGTITDGGAYFDPYTGTNVTGYACIWNGSNGALMTTAACTGMSANGTGAGQQAWHYFSGMSYFIPGGTSLAIGFWSPQANGIAATLGPSGTTYSGTQSGSPGTASGGVQSTSGNLAVYFNYTALTAPTISAATPNPGVRGNSITITGTNFLSVTGVTINSVAAASYTVNSSTQITATIANTAAAGTGTITVSNAAGTSAGFAYGVAIVPSINGASPNPGVRNGSVVITGGGFTYATGVTINSVAASSFTINSDTQITATIAGTATIGSGSITVTTAAGTSGAFPYGIATTPSISGFSPNPAPPGHALTISGSGFLYTTTVTIGGTSVSFTVVNDTSITTTVPSNMGGVVSVVVTNAAGSGSANLTIVSAHIYRSGAWTYATNTKVYRSGGWVTTNNIKIYRSGAWVSAQ